MLVNLHASQATRSDAERIRAFIDLYREGALPTAVPALPLLLNHDGLPYTLNDHFPFEDLYLLNQPKQIVFKTSRQVGKTTNMAARGIVLSASQPRPHGPFRSLYLTPLYEQIRRFSTNYVQPFIDNSPVRRLLVSSSSSKSVLQRTFRNDARMIFSFAGTSVDRVRGVTADELFWDEVQNVNKEHLPIAREVISHSDLEWERYIGTPLTQDGTLESLWRLSSMAEWFIPCTHCTENGKPTLNIPSIDHHLYRMITRPRWTISEAEPALACHRCSKPIYPRLGRWVHRKPERQFTFPGYHMPRVIMPMHYSRKDKWFDLLRRMEGYGNTTPAVFHNEVLGESYDKASKLVTEPELIKASVLGPRGTATVKKWTPAVRAWALAADWGGGGIEQTSLTTLALVGLLPNNKLIVPWGARLLNPNDHPGEAKQVLYAWNLLRPTFLAHDYTGAGALRETLLLQMGIPERNIFAAQYGASAKRSPVNPVAPTAFHPRAYYQVDKARTLQLTCNLIRLGGIEFFDWDHGGDENPGLPYDFLALVEEKVQTMAAGETYRIDKLDGMTDDFAQAVNIGAACLFHRFNAWPNLRHLMQKYELTDAQLREIDGGPGGMEELAAELGLG
jgi:hypothetical protein